MHSEQSAEPSHLATDRTEADHQDDPPGDSSSERELPYPAFLQGRVVREPFPVLEQPRENELGDDRCTDAGGIRQRDSRLRQPCRNIVGDSGPDALDPFQSGSDRAKVDRDVKCQHGIGGGQGVRLGVGEGWGECSQVFGVRIRLALDPTLFVLHKVADAHRHRRVDCFDPRGRPRRVDARVGDQDLEAFGGSGFVMRYPSGDERRSGAGDFHFAGDRIRAPAVPRAPTRVPSNHEDVDRVLVHEE